MTRILPVNSVPFQPPIGHAFTPNYYSTIQMLASGRNKNSMLITSAQKHSELVPATLRETFKTGKNNHALVRKAHNVWDTAHHRSLTGRV